MYKIDRRGPGGRGSRRKGSKNRTLGNCQNVRLSTESTLKLPVTVPLVSHLVLLCGEGRSAVGSSQPKDSWQSSD